MRENRETLLLQCVRKAAAALRGPAQRTFGIAPCRGFHQRLKSAQQFRLLLRLRLAPATGTANSAGLARRRLPAEFPQTPANGRTRHPRDLGDKPDPAAPKASRLGRRQQPPAPLVKIRSQSLVSIFDTIRVVHSLYIEDIPILRNPPSNHPPDHSVIRPKLAGIVPSSAQAPGARGGLGTPGRRGRTGGLRQDRSNFHVHPHKEKGAHIVPVRAILPSLADSAQYRTRPALRLPISKKRNRRTCKRSGHPASPIGRTPNVILAKSCAHQEAARRSIKNSTISDSIVRGRALGEHAVAFNAGIGSDSGDPPVGGWPRVGPERLADGFRRRHAARVDELEGALRSRIMAQPSTCRCAASRTRVRRRPST